LFFFIAIGAICGIFFCMYRLGASYRALEPRLGAVGQTEISNRDTRNEKIRNLMTEPLEK